MNGVGHSFAVEVPLQHSEVKGDSEWTAGVIDSWGWGVQQQIKHEHWQGHDLGLLGWPNVPS